MDDHIERLMQDKAEAWLDALPSYQCNIIKDILKSEPDPLKAAEIYLSAKPSKTCSASASLGANVFLEKVLIEIEAFLCGDSKYKTDREKLAQASLKIHHFAISLLSSVIAQQVGLSAIFLAPVIVLIVMSIGRISLNAWCEMRREQSESASSNS